LLLALAGCRGGLPPEPPGADPVDPAAAASPYHAPANPYETSAFVGDKAAPAGDHAGHMHHGHAGHAMQPGAATQPAASDHANHAPATSTSSPHAGHKQEAPR
jgi:hypothetical protein